jgi:hypothetical protein
MTSAPTDDDDELNGEQVAGSDDSGKGKKGKKGKGEQGKAGAVSGGVKLDAQHNKEVWSVFRQLNAQELVDAVTEFFSEFPMRASANLAVTWERTKNNVKSFAIVNWAIDAGEAMVRELARTRERGMGAAGRDSRGLQRQKPKANYGINPNPGPVGAQ